MKPWQRAIWIVTFGPVFAVAWIVFAGLAAVTVVALPWARTALRVAAWAAWPTAEVPSSSWEPGSNVQDAGRPGSNAGYFVWLAVGGLWLCVLHHVAAALMALTLVGIAGIFPHLELGRVALVLNPGAFRMAVPSAGRAGLPFLRSANRLNGPKTGVHLP